MNVWASNLFHSFIVLFNSILVYCSYKTYNNGIYCAKNRVDGDYKNANPI